MGGMGALPSMPGMADLSDPTLGMGSAAMGFSPLSPSSKDPFSAGSPPSDPFGGPPPSAASDPFGGSSPTPPPTSGLGGPLGISADPFGGDAGSASVPPSLTTAVGLMDGMADLDMTAVPEAASDTALYRAPQAPEEMIIQETDYSEEARAKRNLEFKDRAADMQANMMGGIMGGFLATKKKSPTLDSTPQAAPVADLGDFGGGGGDFGDFGGTEGGDFGDFGSRGDDFGDFGGGGGGDDFGDFGGGGNDAGFGDFGGFADSSASAAPATPPEDKRAKLMNMFVDDAAPAGNDASDATMPAAGQDVFGSFGDGEPFGAMDSTIGRTSSGRSVSDVMEELITSERLEEALEISGRAAKEKEVLVLKDAIEAKRAEYIRLKEEDMLQEAMEAQKEYEDMQEALVIATPRHGSADTLAPPPPGHMTMEDMRNTIKDKCGLDKAASFAQQFPRPLVDIAKEDLSAARDVQREARRWLRTLCLLTGDELQTYGHAWCTAAQRARGKFAEALTAMTNLANAVVSEEESVLQQTAQDPKLVQFARGVAELYRTTLKVEASAIAHPFCGEGEHLEETKKACSEVKQAWTTLRSVMTTIGVELEDVGIDPQGCWNTSDDFTSTTGDWGSCCALTLLPIPLGTTESTVTWKGRRYLTSSANFWLHCVSEVPPSEFRQEG